ncbi:hypothetical protein [Sphingomicrobium lutaoense]|uniref:Uncharacterized protein n=1 Tax=Sphingomicrobium lutaoense TaxID=515949 RepID=A0A839Z5U0_9SPHN|nr:hypothetical protein [Sphingomicrobium lutaoense]MBB3765045.1 hypothetical protein [Sphingomicrobium lutaoense]
MTHYSEGGPSRKHNRVVTIPRETIAHLIDDLVLILLADQPQEREERSNG